MHGKNTGTRRGFLGLAAALASSVPLLARAGEPAAAGAAPPEPGYLIIYRPGPKWLPGRPFSEQGLKEHGRYLLDLHRRGILRMAGGFGDNSGGAAFVDAPSIEEARALAEADPAVTAQKFEYEVREWRLVPWERLANRAHESAG